MAAKTTRFYYDVWRITNNADNILCEIQYPWVIVVDEMLGDKHRDRRAALEPDEQVPTETDVHPGDLKSHEL